MATYEIVTAMPGEFAGRTGGDWDSDGIGSPNEFATIEEAEEAIVDLQALGEEWAAGTYAVREIGKLYPESRTIVAGAI